MQNDRDPLTGKINWAPGEREAFRAEQKARKMAARAERDARAEAEKAERDARLAAYYAAQKGDGRPPERAWVQTALKTKGRTLTELAEAWDVSPPTITKWLDGTVSMTALTLERAVFLADMLGIDLTELARRLGLNPPATSPGALVNASERTSTEPLFAVERTGKGYRVRVDAVVSGSAGAALAKAVLAAADEEMSWEEK